MTSLPRGARVAFCVAVALLIGCGLGLVHHLFDDGPLGLSLAVFIPMVGLPAAVAIGWVIWPTPKMRDEQRRAEYSIERSWAQEAMASSFFGLGATLMWCDVIGRTFDIGWLSPLTMWHVGVASIIVGALNYGVVRMRANR